MPVFAAWTESHHGRLNNCGRQPLRDCLAFSLTLAEFERNRGDPLYRDGRGKTGSGSPMKNGNANC